MKGYCQFVKQFLIHPSSVGSLFPSSKPLARALTHPMVTSSPRRYLEVGAGSGAVTQSIVKKMSPGDTLDIVEKDPLFCRTLQEKYSLYPQITIYPLSIVDFPGSGYDLVVSSLPLNSFSSGLVGQILRVYEQLVKPGGTLVYFEYMGIGTLKKWCLSPRLRQDFLKTLSLKADFIATHGAAVKQVWCNIPPARVFSFRLYRRELLHRKKKHASRPLPSEVAATRTE